MPYDSFEDTQRHRLRVAMLLGEIAGELRVRANEHDESKLVEPEKPIFDEYTPKLKDSTYGSDEYKRFLDEMKVALDHHYSRSRHHPEHFANGVNDMTLVDLVEMLCDWKAATERHANGNIKTSIEQNTKRFGLSGQLARIFENTRLAYFQSDAKV